MPITLSIKNAAKSFGGLEVFSSIDLEVAQGAHLGIIGPNGAGKSTLFNLISGMFAPTSGTIEFCGKSLATTRPWTRCRAGIARTFQIPQPFAQLTVRENIMVGCLHGAGMSMRNGQMRTDEVLELTGLADQADQSAADLALLDLKRLELSRAIALRPKLLLLDEIAGGLTDAECQSLLKILHEITTPEMSIIWIEHVIHALTKFVADVAVLADKRIIARGHPDTVFQDAEVRRLYFGTSEVTQ